MTLTTRSTPRCRPCPQMAKHDADTTTVQNSSSQGSASMPPNTAGTCAVGTSRRPVSMNQQ